MMGRTRTRRTRRSSAGWNCTTQLHNSHRNCSPTCSNLEQVLVWERRSLGSAAVLELAEVLESVQPLSAAEVLESVQPLSALEWVRRAEL
jgi:hypothetical protein